jgi:hypothetical protein
MNFRYLLLATVAFSGLTVSACATQPQTPKDVEDFIFRRETCDHYRGEIPDPSQVEELRETIRQANEFCAGTDAALAALKARYKDDPTIMEKLNVFEPRIEVRRK